MIFIKILKNTIQLKSVKFLFFYLMISLLICFEGKDNNLIVTELFIRVRKRNISLAFVTQSCFAVPKHFRLNSRHYFIIKIQDKGEL